MGGEAGRLRTRRCAQRRPPVGFVWLWQPSVAILYSAGLGFVVVPAGRVGAFKCLDRSFGVMMLMGVVDTETALIEEAWLGSLRHSSQNDLSCD